ncbi:kinase-like domain-containing protein [Aspergillus granulosus]|uniref:Kinase-like domain-containing protein n=1 Tax=Aspergillus granulosus TaxID=176169 RepID=A0ABR4HC01_9EURO
MSTSSPSISDTEISSSSATAVSSCTPPSSDSIGDLADFGDVLSDEDDQVEIEEYAEPWHQYNISDNTCILYPVCLGEILNNRYLVEHKLGFGAFSTVWMARDLEDKRDVALKVMCLGEYAEHEARIQEQIIRNVQDTSHLVTYLTTFELPRGDGGGCHKVLVLPLMGPCVSIYTLGSIPMAARMSAARQLLEALEQLHNAGIVHRDLSDANCMWEMAPLHHLDRKAKYEALGRPRKEAIPYVDLWRKGDLVEPAKIPTKLRTDKFYLGDFSLSMQLDDTPAPVGSPPFQFCSPDRLHGKEPTTACDMWSYMVIFSQLYLGFPPFSYYFNGTMSCIVMRLGPLPTEWRGSYYRPDDAPDSWYDQNKKPDQDKNLASVIAHRRPETDQPERDLARTVMEKVFHFCPEKRLSATQLLRDDSFNALMAKYGC